MTKYINAFYVRNFVRGANPTNAAIRDNCAYFCRYSCVSETKFK